MVYSIKSQSKLYGCGVTDVGCGCVAYSAYIGQRAGKT